jgi:hypothetical protein
MLDKVRYAPEVHERAFDAWRHHLAHGKAESTVADWLRVVAAVYEAATPHERIARGDPAKAVNEAGIGFPNPGGPDLDPKRPDLKPAAPMGTATATVTATGAVGSGMGKGPL